MSTNPLRDAATAKYGGVTTLPSQSTPDASGGLNSVRAAAVAKYSTTVPVAPSPTTTPATDPRSAALAKYGTPAGQVVPPVAVAPATFVPADPNKDLLKNTFSEIGRRIIDIPVNTLKGMWETYKGTPNKIMEDVAAGAKDMQSGGTIDEQAQAFFKGAIKTGGRVAGDAAIAIFAPVSSAIGAAIEATGGQPLMDNAGQVIADKSGITDIKAFQKFAMEHPNAGEDFNRLATLFMAGGEKGKIDPVRIAEQSKAIAERLVTNKTVTEGPGQSMFIDPTKVKSIFQTGDKISAEELDLIKQLGLTTKQYGDAVRNGITIDIPSTVYTTIADKPWFAKLKTAIGLKPMSETFSAPSKPGIGAEGRASRLLSGDTTTAPISPTTLPTEANKPVQTVSESQVVTPPVVKEVLSSPITPSLLDRVQNFTPFEANAFGRNLIQSINKELGNGTIDNFGLPENIQVNEFKHSDGRPAQFNPQTGKIEIFLPTLKEDLQMLASGETITAHPNSLNSVHTTVYKMKGGETFPQLGARYAHDVVLHEMGHENTPLSPADAEQVTLITREINQAKRDGNDGELIKALQKKEVMIQKIEDTANQYVKDHRAELEKQMLGNKPSVKNPNQFERRAMGIPEQKKITTTERALVREKAKALSKGSRIGFTEGKKVGVEQTKTELTGRFQTTIEKIRAREATIAEMKSAAIDYAQLLPKKNRADFLRRINKLSTMKNFLDIVDQMRVASKAVERQVLVQKITEELKGTIIGKRDGLPNVKFAYEQQKTLNEMRAVQKMSYAEAQMQISNKVSDWVTAHPDDPTLSIEMLHEIGVLKSAGLKEQSVEELASVLSDIQSLKENGKMLKELQRFNLNTEIDRAKEKIHADMIGQDFVKGNETYRREKIRSSLKIAQDFLTTDNSDLGELLDVMSSKDLSTKHHRSFLYQYVMKRISDGVGAEFTGTMEWAKRIPKIIEDVYGITKEKDQLKLIAELKKVHDLGEFKNANGDTVRIEFTRSEAIDYYAKIQVPELMETFTNPGGMAWTPEIMKAVENLLTAEDKQVATDNGLQLYRDYYPGVNEAFVFDFGYDMPFDANYTPIVRDVQLTIPENVLLAQEGAKYASVKNGSLKQRVNSKLELKPTDFFLAMNRHIAKMEHYKAFHKSIYEIRSIFSDKKIRKTIRGLYGQHFLDAVDSAINDIARAGVAREKIVNGVDILRANTTKAMLGINPTVAIKQLTGITNYGIELPVKDFFVGIATFGSNPMKWGNFIFEHSPSLKERFAQGFERDMKFELQQSKTKNILKSSKVDDLMFLGIRASDAITVMTGSTAAFLSEYRRITGHTFEFDKPMDERAVHDAIQYAEELTNRVQESSQLHTLSPLQRGGSLMKLFTMFANQPSKYLRIITSVIRNYRSGRMSATEASKMLFWVLIVVPMIYNLVADMFIDPKYRPSLAGQLLTGPFTTPLIVGGIVQQIFGWVSGNKFSYQASPVEAFMNDVLAGIGKFQKKHVAPEDVGAGLTRFIDAAGKLGGVPTGIITKPIRDSLTK